VTLFIVACGLMVAVALAFIAWPLLKSKKNADGPRQRGVVALIVLAIAIPASAALLYIKVGRLHWQQEIADAATNPTVAAPDVLAMIAKLEQRLHDAPNDIDGWIMLGRSYAALEKPTQALTAYQKAYDLSSGNNIDAAMGLGEAMIVVDERSIAGKAGELFELVLAREPNNPKALWYGAIGALTRGNLPMAHQRFQHMLTLNPPQEVRTIIERQLQDIEQQLSASGQSLSKPPNNTPAPAAREKTQQSDRAITVHVSIAPELTKGLDKKTPLFVLARDPNAPGPPLAAVRRAVGDLPLTVTITDSDAMMAGRGISSVPRVQVVARISKTGTPQAQTGDLFGDAAVDFAAKPAAEIKILIDRAVAAAGGK
jgi:cytochrome c-type biogenesis protein CcmH